MMGETNTSSNIREKRIDLFFRVGIFLKGLFSLTEVTAGILAFFIPASSVTTIIINLAQGELSEDPGDFIASHIIPFAQQISIASGVFIAFYLLSRGLIKLFLVFALLKNQLWAYPSSLVVLSLFVLYQLDQIIHTFSPLLIVLTLFDFVVMWLIWAEYKIVEEHLKAQR
jgi:uncharacterized membrane protein